MRVHYVTGSRADFGLMQGALRNIHESGRHEVGLVVTGQHLIEDCGDTVHDIYRSGIPIVAQLPVTLSGAPDGGEMALAAANELIGFVELWRVERPDLLMILGDRLEMLAGALAAVA